MGYRLQTEKEKKGVKVKISLQAFTRFWQRMAHSDGRLVNVYFVANGVFTTIEVSAQCMHNVIFYTQSRFLVLLVHNVRPDLARCKQTPGSQSFRPSPVDCVFI